MVEEDSEVAGASKKRSREKEKDEKKVKKKATKKATELLAELDDSNVVMFPDKHFHVL